MRKFYYIFILALLIQGCRPVRQTIVPSGGEPNANAYIEKYKELAISEMKRTGIPASITLAQGMIESDFGRSRLAREANNHFGIKCHNNWTGPTIRHNDDRRNECFRKYRRPEESFYDHSDFLKEGSRYAFLFDLSSQDYKGWARGLKKAGYATNPDYSNMLIRKIEENNLSRFDRRDYRADAKIQPAVEPAITEEIVTTDTIDDPKNVPYNSEGDIKAIPVRIRENNRIQYIIVREGETAESIQEDFQLLKWELAKYNELEAGFIPQPGQILYLQPKRDKAEPGKEFHTVLEGETIHLISQKYGVRVKKLYEYNRLSEGTDPEPGTRIWLRNMKPVN
jgi:LysM repeat protein